MTAQRRAGRRLPVTRLAILLRRGPGRGLSRVLIPALAPALACALAAALAAPSAAAAQGALGSWMPLGPNGGEVTGLAADPAAPKTLYATTLFAGLFKSTDGGATWAQASSGLDIDGLQTVAASPAGVLFAAAGSGIFRSLDHAASWQRVTLRRQFVAPTRFAFDPFSAATVYAASSSGGAFKSTDGGTTWASIGDGLGAPAGSIASATVQALAAGPRRGLLVAGSQFGLYHSANGGADWTPVYTQCAVQALLFDPVQPLRIYAGCTKDQLNPPSQRAVVVSQDGGLTWTRLAGPFSATGVFSLAAVPRTRQLLAGTDQGIYLSRDAGAHWAPLASFGAAAQPQPAGAAVAVGALAVTAGPAGRSPVIYAGTGLARDESAFLPGNGVWRSPDLGASWSAASAGLAATTVQALAVDFANGSAANVNLYAGTTLGLYRSRSAGATWQPFDHGLADPDVTALGIWSPPTPPASAPLIAPAPLYAVSSQASVAVSFDAGKTWTDRGQLPTLGNSVFPFPVTGVAVDPLDPNHVLVAGGADVFQSHDAGANWDVVSGLPFSGSGDFVAALAFAPSQPATVYAVASWFPPGGIVAADAVYKSVDGGANWKPSGLNGGRLQALAIDPLDPDLVYVGGHGDIYQTSDGGATWIPLGFPVNTGGSLGVTALTLIGGPSTFLLTAAVGGLGGTVGGGPSVWISSAPGVWDGLGPNQPPTQEGVNALAFDPLRLRLYAATPGAGVWTIEVQPPP